MGRNVLLITTDQQRFDALGCNGGEVARTPVADRLATEGINFTRAYNQNTVCMPARSSILTGQYVRTHGVVANGIPLPRDAPSIAALLRDRAGYRTALLGKAHFEPGFDPQLRWDENRRPAERDTGLWRGFDRSIQAAHAAAFGEFPILHYGRWLQQHHPEHMRSYAALLGARPGGDTGAPETKNNPIPRGLYHTDWVADLVVDQLDEYADDDDWFVWMSFPDPHHPWDPPESELHRVPWRELDLPPGHPGSRDAVRDVLSRKPRHWLDWYDGTWANAEGGPGAFFPATLTDDMVREITAKTHVMNELIDEACGRVIERIDARGWLDDTDIFFTTDHGELLGDFGLLYKGPFHVDALMRLPFIWRPAPSAGLAKGCTVSDPVQQIDLTATICSIAGIEQPDWIQGRPLPIADGQPGFERAICEWDSQFPAYGMHLRTVVRDGWLCTMYEPSTGGVPNGLERTLGDAVLAPNSVQYDGTEGELYRLDEDPHQWHNRWDDPGCAAVRRDLVDDLVATLRELPTTSLLVEAPA
jgi:arylsulfatase A-like enzyme